MIYFLLLRLPRSQPVCLNPFEVRAVIYLALTGLVNFKGGCLNPFEVRAVIYFFPGRRPLWIPVS